MELPEPDIPEIEERIQVVPLEFARHRKLKIPTSLWTPLRNPLTSLPSIFKTLKVNVNGSPLRVKYYKELINSKYKYWTAKGSLIRYVSVKRIIINYQILLYNFKSWSIQFRLLVSSTIKNMKKNIKNILWKYSTP